MLTIGIFGPPDDQEVDALKNRLQNRGVRPWVIDLSKFPSELNISFSQEDIIINDRSIFDCGIAFLRSRGINVPNFARYDENFKTDSKEKWAELYKNFLTFVRYEIKYQKIRNSVIEAFTRRRRLVNPLFKNDLHRLKTYLFWHLKRNGIRVPEFIVGTSSPALKGFAENSLKAAEGAVEKPMAGIYKTFLWSQERWNNHKWEERGSFYQYYIRGDTIRCYVLGGKLIASAVIIHRDTVDSSMSQTGIEVIDLPPDAKKLAENTAKVLDLSFCGLDIMNDAKSGYYLVDCNISPMFVNFARLSFIDIPAMITDYLIECAETQGPETKGWDISILNEAKDILATDPDIRRMIYEKQSEKG